MFRAVGHRFFLMKYGAYIPLSGMPFSHDPRTFPRLKKWQIAAALEVVHQYVQEGKVLGPFPGWHHPMLSYNRASAGFLSFFRRTKVEIGHIQMGP